MSKTYRDQVVILKRIEFGEADVILSVFGRQQGIVSAIAKGARRIKSGKSGTIELFSQIDVLFSQGRNLDIISEAVMVDSFDSWRNELECISLAYYVTDITNMLLAEGEQYTYVYDRLIEFYAWLGKTPSAAMLVRWYEVQLLNSLGFWSSQELNSPSINAIALLDSFAQQPVQSLISIKGSTALDEEMERLMREQLAIVLDRQPKSQKFVAQVREM